MRKEVEEGGKEERVEMREGIGNRGRTKREGRKDKRGGDKGGMKGKKEWGR